MKITAIFILLGVITLSALTATSSPTYAQIQQQPPSQNMTGGISANNATNVNATTALGANVTNTTTTGSGN